MRLRQHASGSLGREGYSQELKTQQLMPSPIGWDTEHDTGAESGDGHGRSALLRPRTCFHTVLPLPRSGHVLTVYASDLQRCSIFKPMTPFDKCKKKKNQPSYFFQDFDILPLCPPSTPIWALPSGDNLPSEVPLPKAELLPGPSPSGASSSL